MDPFEAYVRAGLEREGIEVDEVDVGVMRAAEAAYGSAMRALVEADLSGVWAEADLDPSRAPSDS